MNSSDGVSKLRVFVSSRCDGKYKIARRAIRKLLEATGLTEVYVYEDTPASSDNNESAFLSEIDRSDLCIIIVDNKDNISHAVLREIRRAQKNNLRLLYIFCNERKKTPTEIQKEIEAIGGQKYTVVSEFADIALAVYDSVIQDIIKIYCKKESPLQNKRSEASELTVNEVFKIGSNIQQIGQLAAFPLVLKTLTAHILSEASSQKKPDESKLDSALADLLCHILSHSKFKKSNIEAICSEMCNTCQEYMKPILLKRFDAQKAYFSGHYNKCLKYLQEAINKAFTSRSVPNWVKNDIAIDIRHVALIIQELKNRIDSKISGQEYIEKNPEPVYYPYLDRQIKNFNEEIINHHYTSISDSPETTRVSDYNSLIVHLANAYCCAETNGSILQTVMLKNRLLVLYELFCFQSKEHKLFFNYIRLAILNGNEKKIDNLIRMYNEPISILNSNEIQEILKGIENTAPHMQVRSKLILITRFGYYMDDATYHELYTELLHFIKNWIVNDNRTINLCSYISDFFITNKYRNSLTDAVSFVCDVFERKLSYCDYFCFKILSKLDFTKMDITNQTRINRLLFDIASGKISCEFYSEYYLTIIRFVSSTKKSVKQLEKALSHSAPEFYNTAYRLSTIVRKKCDITEYIKSQVQEIESLINTNNDFNTNPFKGNNYDNIHFILSSCSQKLTNSILVYLLDTTITTLTSNHVTASIKSSAIKVIQTIYFKYPGFSEWPRIKKRLLDNIPISCHTSNHFMLEKLENAKTLDFQYSLFLGLFDKAQSDLCVQKLLSLDRKDAYLMENFLVTIFGYLSEIPDNIYNKDILTTFMYYCIETSRHQECKIRHYAVLNLIKLTQYKQIQKPILSYLSRLMDYGTHVEKIAVLNGIDHLKSTNNSFVKQIKNKGKADTNFLVRLAANDN